MNFGHTRARLVQAGAALAAAALIAGCGNNYRPVVTPVNPSGPPAQPQSYVVAVSAPSTTAPGLVGIIDYSGDSVMVSGVPIGPGPSAFTLDETGSNGYTINSDGTLTNFPVSSTLQAKSVTITTLPSLAKPLNLFSPSSGLWAADLCATLPPSTVCEDAADVFTGSPQDFVLSIPLPPAPIMVVGPGLRGQRYFALTQNIANPTGMECNFSTTTLPTGEVTGIEVGNNTTDIPIPVGQCPVYAVESSDGQRLFVINRGSDTISVINVSDDTLDQCVCPPNGCVNQDNQTYTCHPTLPLSTNAVTTTGITPPNGTTSMPATAQPVYAEYNAAKNLLVVADYAGNAISVIDVSLDEFGNDSSTFGTTYTIPVGAGTNPASVTVLLDGSRAYTANQSTQTVTIANLSSYTVEKTLPVTGHPRTVVNTQNSVFGKVYVASPDSPYLTIIATGGTNPDTVDTTLDLYSGNIVDVRVQTQNGVSGNNNNLSRIPGYGQPCNLPLSEFNPATSTNNVLANCQAQAVSLLK
jgi:DNA-binding beta-propeller fold protein YncE